jgi:hypothetical protein
MLWLEMSFSLLSLSLFFFLFSTSGFWFQCQDLWSEKSMCAVLGHCRQNVVATVNDVFFSLSSSQPVTFLLEGVVLGLWNLVSLSHNPTQKKLRGNFKSFPIVLKFWLCLLRSWGRFFKGDYKYETNKKLFPTKNLPRQICRNCLNNK